MLRRRKRDAGDEGPLRRAFDETVALVEEAKAALVAVVPAFAGAETRQGTSGTWTFTDVTPDPSNTGSGPKCFTSDVPQASVDVNTYEIKAKKKSQILSTVSHNTLDWTAEVADSRGNVVASYDGGTPDVKENISLPLRKGTYTVSYCNWAGEPQITVDWSLK